jgi:hypothetical protein
MNIAGEHREAGDECDVDGEVASYLVKMDRAALIRSEQPNTPERGRRSERATQRR